MSHRDLLRALGTATPISATELASELIDDDPDVETVSAADLLRAMESGPDDDGLFTE